MKKSLNRPPPPKKNKDKERKKEIFSAILNYSWLFAILFTKHLFALNKFSRTLWH